MPDDDYDDPDVPEDSEVIRTLRSKLQAAEKDAKEAPDLRKKLALHDAGLGGLNEDQRTALFAVLGDKGLTGDLLKATAITLGFSEPPEPDPPQVPAEEQAAHQRAAEATSGAQASEAEKQTLTDEINAATSPEAVVALLAREQMLPQE